MKKTDDFIVNRIVWRAGLHGLPSKFAFYFKDLSPDIQHDLNQYIDKESGQPVLYFTKPTKEWTLVCTRQVICNNNQTIFKVNIRDIKRLKPTAIAHWVAGQTVDINEVKKAEWHQLTIIDQSGNTYEVHTGKGEDFFALFNILLMLWRIN